MYNQFLRTVKNWKQFKQNLKPNYWTGKKNYHIIIYKGKCEYCGKPITFNEFYGTSKTRSPNDGCTNDDTR